MVKQVILAEKSKNMNIGIKLFWLEFSFEEVLLKNHD